MNTLKFVAGMVATAALVACVSPAARDPDRPFDPAACYPREFSVYFEGLDTRLSREAREIIDLAVESVRGCRIQHVRIVGLADARGHEEVSEEVSIERARSVADYLARTVGWPRESFELRATGERGAVTEEGLARPMRRRTHVTVDAAAP